jgi:hypothetical protein
MCGVLVSAAVGVEVQSVFFMRNRSMDVGIEGIQKAERMMQ